MAKQISTDDELNLKRQARRRLIGAVALVIAIIVILPMVFDREPVPSTANDIELRIPDKDGLPPLQTTVPNEQYAESSAASVPVAASAVSEAPVPAVNAVPSLVQPSSKAAERKAKPETKPKSDVKTAGKTSEKPIPHSGWVVQVGAYSNVDTAKQLQVKLSKMGYHAYTEKAGNVLRVRVGSYPTREAAEKIQHKLEAMGQQPNVVNLD